jgi:hypothetical protein
MCSRRSIVALVAAALAVVGTGCHRAGGDPRRRAPAALAAIAIESRAAYTEITAIPIGEGGRAIERDARRRGADVVAWPAVEAQPLRYLGGAIDRDEFGLRDRLDEVLRLVAERPGRSIAITWDGGLAETEPERALASSRRSAARAWPADLPAPEREADDPLSPRRLLDR